MVEDEEIRDFWEENIGGFGWDNKNIKWGGRYAYLWLEDCQFKIEMVTGLELLLSLEIYLTINLKNDSFLYYTTDS